MVQLTEAVIKSKTRLNNLNEVKNLNLWGQGITGLAVLARTPNVEILSLSVNCISSLRDLVHCQQLKELYLRKNEVASLNDVRYLMSLPHLKVLWLSDNPVAELPSYRSFLIANLPKLEKLDNVDVTAAERAAVQHLPCLQPATLAEVLAASIEQQEPGPLTTPSRDDSRTTLAAVPACDAAEQVAASPASARITGQLNVDLSSGSEVGVRLQESIADQHLLQQQPRQHQQYNPQCYSSRTGQPELSLHHDLQEPAMTACPGWSPLQQPLQAAAVVQSSKNVLYAVMALLGDLDATSLGIVQKEVQQRLQVLHELWEC